jgi:hypothetical protein
MLATRHADAAATAAMLVDQIAAGVWAGGPLTLWLWRRIYWDTRPPAAGGVDTVYVMPMTDLEARPGWRRGTSGAIPWCMTLYGQEAGRVRGYGRAVPVDEVDAEARKHFLHEIAKAVADGYAEDERVEEDDLLFWSGVAESRLGPGQPLRVTILMAKPEGAVDGADPVIGAVGARLSELRPRLPH